MAEHTIVAQVYYDRGWHTVESHDRDSDEVTINRGQADEQAEPAPSSAGFVLANADGLAWPGNPASPLWDVAGVNTPALVGLGTPNLGAAAASGVNSTSHVAPSVTAEAAGLLICVWAAPTSTGTYTVPESMSREVSHSGDELTMAGAREVITAAGATGTRTATLDESTDQVCVSVFVHGPDDTLPGSVISSGDSLDSFVTSSAGELLVLVAAFPADPVTGVPAVPAAPSDDDGGGWLQLADTGDVSRLVRLVAWVKRVNRTPDSAYTIELPGASDDTLKFFTHVAASDVGWDVRHVGEVSAWRPDRTLGFSVDGPGNAWVAVESAGILHRLEQGAEPLISPMRRAALSAVTAANVAAYWPGEDGARSGQVASGLPGGRPMSIIGTGTVSFASYEGFGGSLPLLELGDNTDLRGLVPPTPDTTGQVFFRCALSTPSGLADELEMVTLYASGGDAARWSLVYHTGGGLSLVGVGDDGTEVADSGTFAFGIDDKHYLLAVELTQVGDDTHWLIAVHFLDDDGTADTAATVAEDDFTDVTAGRCTAVSIGGSGGMDGCAVGHIGVANKQAWMFSKADILTGHLGELAGTRFLRLCEENRIPASIVGSVDDTPPMGAQQPGTLTDALGLVRATDAGLLVEPRSAPALTYRTLRSLYAQTAALTLDWDEGEVAPPLSPVLDTSGVRNDVTVANVGGTSARAVKETGALNVNRPNDEPPGVGRFQATVAVNARSEGFLRNRATWELSVGTVPGARFAQVSVDLDASPTLATAASRVGLGDRLTITNVPTDLSPEDVDLLVVGVAPERLKRFRRVLTFNCVPYGPYRVGVWGSSSATTTSRYDHGASTLEEPADEDDTTLSVNTVGPLWTTKSASLPFDIQVGGERMTVTAVSGTSSPQTMTVTRAVNGVAKSHADNAKVSLAEPVHWGL